MHKCNHSVIICALYFLIFISAFQEHDLQLNYFPKAQIFTHYNSLTKQFQIQDVYINFLLNIYQ